NDRVLDRNDVLVVVAIERPGLELAARQLALVHQLVERMAVVVALRADRPQACFECARRQQLVALKHGHSISSMPSQAISHPESRTIRFCSLASSNIGLVLLMWIYILR